MEVFWNLNGFGLGIAVGGICRAQMSVSMQPDFDRRQELYLSCYFCIYLFPKTDIIIESVSKKFEEYSD